MLNVKYQGGQTEICWHDSQVGAFPQTYNVDVAAALINNMSRYQLDQLIKGMDQAHRDGLRDLFK